MGALLLLADVTFSTRLAGYGGGNNVARMSLLTFGHDFKLEIRGSV